MNKRGYILIAVLAVLAVAYSIGAFVYQKKVQTLFFDKMPEEVRQIVDDTVDAINEDDIQTVLSLSDKRIRNEQSSEANLQKIFDSVLGQIIKHEVVGYYVNSTDGTVTHEVTIELTTERRFYLVYIITSSKPYELIGMNSNEIFESVTAVEPVKLSHINLYEILLILCSLLVFTVSLFVAGHAFSLKEKSYLLWVLIAFVGLGSYNRDIVDNIYNYNLLGFGIPPASLLFTSLYLPTVVGLRFPIGVLAYWLKLRKEGSLTFLSKNFNPWMRRNLKGLDLNSISNIHFHKTEDKRKICIHMSYEMEGEKFDVEDDFKFFNLNKNLDYTIRAVVERWIKSNDVKNYSNITLENKNELVVLHQVKVRVEEEMC